MSYFAVDCFHFRTKGHRVAAAALWNNMVSVGLRVSESVREIARQINALSQSVIMYSHCTDGASRQQE